MFELLPFFSRWWLRIFTLVLLSIPLLSFSQSFDARFVYRDTVVAEYAQTIKLIFQRANTWPDSVIYDVYMDQTLSSATNGADVQFNTYFRQSDAQTLTYDTLNLEIKPDFLIEDTEHVYIVISNCDRPNLAVDTLFHLTILPSDTLTASFFGAGFSVVEDSPWVYVPVTLSTPVADTIQVLLTLAPGNAILNDDFMCADSQLITWLPFTQDTFFFPVQILNDQWEEFNEQINFDLTRLKGDAIMDVIAYTLTIVDNDSSTLSLTDEVLANFTFFPVPFDHSLIVSSMADGNLVIHNGLGQLMDSRIMLHGERLTIPTSEWPKGFYVANWEEKGKQYYQKLLK